MAVLHPALARSRGQDRQVLVQRTEVSVAALLGKPVVAGPGVVGCSVGDRTFLELFFRTLGLSSLFGYSTTTFFPLFRLSLSFSF